MELIGNKVRGHGDIAHLIHRPAFIRPAELNNLNDYLFPSENTIYCI